MYLTPRRKKFIQHYTEDCFGKGTESALKAGYSPKSAKTTASKLLAEPYIRKLVDARIEGNKLSPEDIERMIVDLIAECTTPRDKRGTLELLAKIKGMFKDTNTVQQAFFHGLTPQTLASNKVTHTDRLT